MACVFYMAMAGMVENLPKCPTIEELEGSKPNPSKEPQIRTNTCKTCRYYVQREPTGQEWNARRDSLGACSNDKAFQDEDALANDGPPLRDDSLVYESDSGCYGLLVGPNFGCIHWEAK